MKTFLEGKKYLYITLDAYPLGDLQTAREIIDYFKIHENIDILAYDWIFFDEVKSVASIGNILKGLIDQYDKKILCSNSGNIHVTSFIDQNLTGRYDVIQVYPLDFLEYLEGIDEQLVYQCIHGRGSIFDIFYKKIEGLYKEYIKFGVFPKVLIYDLEKKKKNGKY